MKNGDNNIIGDNAMVVGVVVIILIIFIIIFPAILLLMVGIFIGMNFKEQILNTIEQFKTKK